MSLRLRNKKWKDSTHMWTRIYQHHSKASLESFVIIFFFVFHYIIIGENYLCIYEEARRMLFWLLNRRFLAHSLMCVILAEEDQKLVSILFILEWVRERERETSSYFSWLLWTFFFIFYWCINNDKKASKAMETIILAIYIFFFCDDYCFMNWTVSRISHLMMILLFFLTTINFFTCFASCMRSSTKHEQKLFVSL